MQHVDPGVYAGAESHGQALGQSHARDDVEVREHRHVVNLHSVGGAPVPRPHGVPSSMRTFSSFFLAAVLLLVASMPANAVSFKATLSSIKLNARPGQILTSAFRLTLDADQPK